MSLRLGAGVAVVALHASVVGAIFLSSPDEPPKLSDPEPVMVSVIEAPVPQMARAEPQPEPQPEPPPPPEPQVEPEPEPEPVVQAPPEPVARPKPPPKPKPKPKQPPRPQLEPKPQLPAPPAQPEGLPEADQQVTQAPSQAPAPAEPVMLTSVEYAGARPVPTYPMASRRLREEGRVVILVEINAQGLVERASIDSSSGYSRLDEAALAAARQARFRPLMRNGVAMAARAKLPFDFVMRN